ncbi:MAG: hypothetical protein ACXADB_06540, partial [Candidatus Hermodarchaeia archaeon]
MSNNAERPRFVRVILILVLLVLFPVASQVNLSSMNILLQTSSNTSHHYPVQSNLLNPNPNLIWNRTYSRSTYDRGYGVVECQDGGFAIIGETRQEGVEFRSDVWLLRVDESGNLLWNTTFGSVDDERGYDLVERRNGGFAFVGIRDGDVY